MIGPTLVSSPELSAPLGLPAALQNGSHKPSLQDAAQGFESIFLAQLLKEMRQSLEPGSLFGHDGGEVYGGMFDQFMAQHLAQGKGMGLAHALMKQLESATSHGSHHTKVPRT